MKKIDTEKIAKLVADTLSKRFENIQIVDVLVEPDRNRDGDEILRIKIIFKGFFKDADAKRMAGATRELRPVLEDEIDDDLFPLLSFVSKIDYDRGMKSEAR